MRTLYVSLLVGVLQVSMVIWHAPEVFGLYKSALTHQVGKSKLVVVGSVTDKRFIWNDFAQGPATEITVKADDVIKGTPNVTLDMVKFMVSGGEAVNPYTGETIKKDPSHQREFEIGEKALFFFNQMYKSTAAYKAHPYDGFYLSRTGKKPIENNSVKLRLLGEPYPKIVLPIDLIIFLGKATVVDRETAMMIEDAILFFMLESKQGTTELPEDLIESVLFTSMNVLEGYEEGVEAAMKMVNEGERDLVTTVSSQTLAEEKGYCRGFVDTMRHHFDVDYHCICNRHWSYQLERPERE